MMNLPEFRMVALTAGLAVGSLCSNAWSESYQVDPAINGVNLNGRIKLSGPIQTNAPVPVYRDSEFCGEIVLSEASTVDPATNGLGGVVVSLIGVERGKPLTASESNLVLEIESKKCRFSPHLSATVVGTNLEIRNLDPILHNLHVRRETRYGPTVINVIQPAGTRSVQKAFRETGFFDVRCDVHPFMSAFVHVFDHPYYAITDDTGSFTMTKVPPGVYTMRIWHEQFGTRDKTIKVPPGESVTVDMEIGASRPLAEPKPHKG